MFKWNEKKTVAEPLPKKISLIIAFKNEEKNLPRLFKALQKLNYPISDFEIILIDDNSTDNSSALAKKFTTEQKNARLVSAKDKEMPGKKGALQIGIDVAKYEYLALTDADCKPESNWLKNVSNAFDRADFLFGAAPLMFSGTLASKFAAYESGQNQTLNFGAMKLGLPVSATGRNIAFKKSVYEKTGGYTNTLERLSGDDDLLLREAIRHNFKVDFINPANAKVFSHAPEKWSDYFKQRARHVSTSHKYLPKQKAFSGLYFLSSVLASFSIFLLPVSFLFALPFLAKIILAKIGNEIFDFFYPKKISFVEIIIFELIFPFTTAINFSRSFFVKSW